MDFGSRVVFIVGMPCFVLIFDGFKKFLGARRDSGSLVPLRVASRILFDAITLLIGRHATVVMDIVV